MQYPRRAGLNFQEAVTRFAGMSGRKSPRRAKSPARAEAPDADAACLSISESADEAVWLKDIPNLVESHGLAAVNAWASQGKHRHRLVHIATVKEYIQALELMRELGFDINVQRDSDKCTPLHLAIFYKKPRAAKTLIALGADRSVKNSYGEACGEAYEKLAASYSHLIWLDCEFTAGFYDEADARLLEVAVIITDRDLNEIDRGQWVLGGFTRRDLLALPEFHQKHFCDSGPGGAFPPAEPGAWGNGLFAEVLQSKLTLSDASAQILRLLGKHCLPRACPIAGNSVQCDREVLALEMPEVVAFLNHRIVDVSSFTGMAERWLPAKLELWKADQKAHANYNHRAINDCEASIRGMAWIRKHLLAPPPSARWISAASWAAALLVAITVPMIGYMRQPVC